MTMYEKRRIAVISDLHFAHQINTACPGRHGEYADIFLLRAIHRFNRYIKPDAVVVAGDLINFPDDADAGALLLQLKAYLDKLQMPYIVIPGNHDPLPEKFYQYFPEQKEITDVGDMRFVSFMDEEVPGYNAHRSDNDFAKMRKAAQDWNGKLIAVQHVPVGYPGEHDCFYNYTNAPEVMKALEECHYDLCIAGHEHAGLPVKKYGGTTFVTAPGLCESPFRYLVLDLDGKGNVAVQEEMLSNDPALELEDHHIHTDFAYCNENLSLAKCGELGRMFGLKSMVFSEHSGHLYFTRPGYKEMKYFTEGLACNEQKHVRIYDWLEAQNAIEPDFQFSGIELDFDRNGKPVIERELMPRFSFVNGAIHSLSASLQDVSYEDTKAEFMRMNEAILKSGVHALAHPFRIFAWGRVKFPAPADLYLPLVKLLKQYGVAAELNFHCNQPDKEFFALCVEHGVKISFGSDTHNLYETGEFYPHMRMMEEIAPGAVASGAVLLKIKDCQRLAFL